MEPIAVEIRAEILAACDAGEGTRVVAVRFGVSESWVRRVKQQRRESNQLARCDESCGSHRAQKRRRFSTASGNVFDQPRANELYGTSSPPLRVMKRETMRMSVLACSSRTEPSPKRTLAPAG